MNVKICKLPHGEDLQLPSYATEGSAGLDLYAAIDTPVFIEPGRWALIPGGFCMELPSGFEIQLRSRSGLAFKKGIFVLNAPGTIDWDYRGEIKVVLANFGDEPFEVKRGERIAQMVLNKVEIVSWAEVSFKEFNASERGDRGFGSTGK